LFAPQCFRRRVLLVAAPLSAAPPPRDKELDSASLKLQSAHTAQTSAKLPSKLGCEGIVSKRLGSPYRSGRVDDWLKIKNPAAPAVKREAEEDWGAKRKGRERPRAEARFLA